MGTDTSFADDTVLISLLQDGEVHHGPVVDYFVEWCDNHFLKLKVNKTKGIAIDFQKKKKKKLLSSCSNNNQGITSEEHGQLQVPGNSPGQEPLT